MVLIGRLDRELPAAMPGFSQLHKEADAAGALPPKFKELMALGIVVVIRCDNCIAYHVHDALKARATHAEMMETLGVAIMIGGGPATMYACEALEALERFEENNQAQYG
jgi:AhpD family alkylhydroperoxidase